MPVFTYHWKDFSIDFVTCFSTSTDWKRDNYNIILVIINYLINMIYYKSVKSTIDVAGVAKVIINVIVRYHEFLKSIINDRGSLFISNFRSSLCYFVNIKRNLFTIFHLQIDGQTKRQNIIIKAYLYAFIYQK